MTRVQQSVCLEVHAAVRLTLASKTMNRIELVFLRVPSVVFFLAFFGAPRQRPTSALSLITVPWVAAFFFFLGGGRSLGV